MPSPYADFKRDGLTLLLKTGRFLCQTVATFDRIIRSKYADQPNIILLLDAIGAVCALLPAAQTEFDAFPSDDGLPPSDPSTIPGINEGAPAPPDIEAP